MKKHLPLLIIPIFLCLQACDNLNSKDIITPDGYTLIWSDEFNEDKIDLTNWTYETGDGTEFGLPSGWGNNEKQIYTDLEENSSIKFNGNNSVLALTAIKKSDENYTSAKLTSKNIENIRFGRIETKAKMPTGQGIWPAIWMLGSNIDEISWPGCGEIDIVELIGNNPNTVYSTIHFTNGEKKHEEIQDSTKLTAGTFNDDYHIFSIDWSPEYLSFYTDEILVQQISIEDDMKEFLRSFYIIMNVAVGGYWPGNPDNTTIFPQTMYVDYIRVFSKDNMEIPEEPTLIIDEETIGQVIEANIGDNAIKEGFTDLVNLSVIAYGGGGEPTVLSSDQRIDGDLSLVFDFPGGNWGGAYIELKETVDLSQYSNLKFSLNTPETLHNVEIKIEIPGSGYSVDLKDYTGTEVQNGFFEYSIPLSDFVGLDKSKIKIPFSLWNPQDVDENFIAATILIDKLYFE